MRLYQKIWSHSDIAEQVIVEGGLEDLRNVRFSMKHLRPSWLSSGQQQQQQQPVWVQDANFFFRLNNSRLITSRFDWRPEIKEELMVSVHTKLLPQFINSRMPLTPIFQSKSVNMFCSWCLDNLGRLCRWIISVYGLSWQNEIGEAIGASHDLRRTTKEWLRVTLQNVGRESVSRAKPILEDMVEYIKPIIIDFR